MSALPAQHPHHTPAPPRRTSEIERQLAAIAAARERSNRPTPLVVGAGIVALLALVILGWGVLSATSARAALTRQRQRAARWDEHMRTIESLSQSTPNLSRLYPISAFIKSDLEAARDAVWAGAPPDAEPLVVNVHRLKRDFNDAPIEEWSVECSSQRGTGLDRLLAFINRAIDSQAGKPAFVSHLELMPVEGSPNWRATMRISNYQVKRDLAGSAE